MCSNRTKALYLINAVVTTHFGGFVHPCRISKAKQKCTKCRCTEQTSLISRSEGLNAGVQTGRALASYLDIGNVSS